jgi:multidrug resistance efflux pump
MTADTTTLTPAPTRTPALGRAWTDVAGLAASFEAGCRAEPMLTAALLALPGTDGEATQLAVWPPGGTPPPALRQAVLRLCSDPRAIDERIDAEAGPQRLVGLRVMIGDTLGAVVALRFDGAPSVVGDALFRWHARLHARPAMSSRAAGIEDDLDRIVDSLDRTPRAPVRASGRIEAATGVRPPDGPTVAGPGLPASLIYRDRPTRADAPAASPAGAPSDDGPPSAAGIRADADTDAQRPAPGRTVASPIELAWMLECQAVVADAGSLDDALHALVATLARQHRCTRVAFGWAKRSGSRVAVLSDGVGSRPSPEVLAPIATAMDEALDQGACVASPALPSREMPVNVAQAQLARVGQSAAVCSVPLVAGGRALGALTLERTVGPFEPAAITGLGRLGSLLAPTLAMRRRADRPLRALGADLADAVVGRRGRVPWLVAGALLAAGVGATIDVPYRVSGAARVEGASQRTMTAPADGFIAKVHVRPGDAVKAGDTMVELDDRDLRLERMRWSSEADQADRQAIEAVAREDRAQYAQHAARAAQARAQLALADGQLARLRVVAPFDGRVLSGDLTQSLGAPVKSGDVLVAVAPEGRHRVIVDVDERDVARVGDGAVGTLALSANAGRERAISVVRVSPAAVARDGRTVFEVEAAAADETDLRPGYQGVAKIVAGERALGRVLLERPWRAVADRLWAWGW